MPTYNASVSFRVRDAEGVERNITTNAEVTVTTIADLEALMESMSEVIDAPLTGRVVDSTVTLSMGVGGNVKSAPEPLSFVGSGGSISFVDTNGGSNPYFFPTLARSKFVGDVLNHQDAEIVALTALWIAGTNSNATASIDFQDDDRRKFAEFSASQNAKKGVYVTRKYRGGR